MVEDTLFRIACGDGAVADARWLEDDGDSPSDGPDWMWDYEPPFMLE